MTKILSAILIGAFVSSAYAQGHERREHERAPYHTPHWVLDDRFHHNHYYPALGYSVVALPQGSLAVSFRGGGRFFFNSGVWYQPAGPGYVVVRPPVGVVVPVLPPAYASVSIAGAPYYYANDVYYAAAPGGYVVAQPPAEGALAQAPGGPPPSSPGNWYYCDSAKGYYPYVPECPAGWRAVPASPPPK
jgi:hypothetical protein